MLDTLSTIIPLVPPAAVSAVVELVGNDVAIELVDKVMCADVLWLRAKPPPLTLVIVVTLPAAVAVALMLALGTIHCEEEEQVPSMAAAKFVASVVVVALRTMQVPLEQLVCHVYVTPPAVIVSLSAG